MALDYSKFDLVDCKVKEQVLIMTLKLPEQGNPIGWLQIKELKNIFGQVKDDGDIRAIIWRGEGEYFSTLKPGFKFHPDKKEPVHPLNGLELAGPDIHQEGAYHMSIIQSILDVPQPIIVCPFNDCGGLVANMVLCCDFILAGDNTTFSDKHCAGGMACGDGGAILWPLVLGPQKAKQYLLACEDMPVVDAERFGLITKIVPVAELDNEAWALAKRLATMPTMAIRFTKHAINRTLWHQMNYSWEFADALQILTCFTDDFAERKNAAKEGRPPVYKGR